MAVKTRIGFSKDVNKLSKREARDLEKALMDLKLKNFKWLKISGKIHKVIDQEDVYMYRVNSYLRLMFKMEKEDIVVLGIVNRKYV